MHIIYIYVCVHSYIYIYIHTHAYAYIYICTDDRHIDIYMYMYIYIYMYCLQIDVTICNLCCAPYMTSATTHCAQEPRALPLVPPDGMGRTSSGAVLLSHPRKRCLGCMKVTKSHPKGGNYMIIYCNLI